MPTMKRFIPILIISNLEAVHSQSILSSNITNVTVFLEGAQVQRKLETRTIAGDQQFRIKGLATNIDPNSIQLRAPEGITIMGVTHEINYIQPNADAAAELIRKRDGLTDDRAKVQQQHQVLLAEKSILAKNQVQVVAVPNNTAKLEDLRLLSDYQRSRLQEILPKIYDLEKKDKKLHEEIETLNRQIAELSSEQPKPSSELVIQAKAASSGNSVFELSYFVWDASWEMRYDIHVRDIQSPLELSYKASVYQNSGEDWKNVRLQLSTANPTVRGDRPILQPWYLRHQPPVVYDQKRAMTRANIQNQVAAAPMAEDNDGVADLVASREQVTSRIYSIDLPYTVLSNNKPFHVAIKKASVAAKYIYMAVPKLDPDAFLTAEIHDWEDLELLNGEAQLFFEGTYQGQVYIDTRTIQDFLRLSLGRDKNVVLLRTKIKDFSKNKFLSDKKEIAMGYEIGIKNNKQAPIDIIVEDQLPLSTQKEIEVKTDDISGAHLDATTGKLRWTLRLSPKEDRKLALKYRISCPKDFVLNLD